MNIILEQNGSRRLLVEFDTPNAGECEAQVLWKSGAAARYSSVPGSKAVIPVDGWFETATVTAVCVNGTRTTDANRAIVPPWRVASSCLNSEYLRVFESDDQRTLLPLAGDAGLPCVKCREGADCSDPGTIGVAGTFVPLADHWPVPWRELGKGKAIEAWAQPCLREGAQHHRLQPP